MLNQPDPEEEFLQASEYVTKASGRFNATQEDMLKFYAFFKQAKVGVCTTSKPAFWNITETKKWEAWKSLGEMLMEDAMDRYVLFLDELDPTWRDNQDVETSSSWRSVSKPIFEEIFIDEADKTIFDYVFDQNIEQITSYIESGGDLNVTDEEGRALIHIAVDIESAELVSVLLERGAIVTIQDADGLTPLHYAVICEHKEILMFLLSKGADPTIKDHENKTAYDLSTDEFKEIFDLFKE